MVISSREQSLAVNSITGSAWPVRQTRLKCREDIGSCFLRMVPLATEMEIRFWHGNRTEQSVAVSSVTGSLGKRDWNMFDTRQQQVAVNSVYTFAWPVKLEYV